MLSSFVITPFQHFILRQKVVPPICQPQKPAVKAAVFCWISHFSVLWEQRRAKRKAVPAKGTATNNSFLFSTLALPKSGEGSKHFRLLSAHVCELPTYIFSISNHFHLVKASCLLVFLVGLLPRHRKSQRLNSAGFLFRYFI